MSAKGLQVLHKEYPLLQAYKGLHAWMLKQIQHMGCLSSSVHRKYCQIAACDHVGLQQHKLISVFFFPQ